MLSKKSDTDEDEEARSSAKVLFKEVEATELQKHLDVWEISEGLPPMQSFPLLIQYHLSGIPSRRSCSKWQGILKQTSEAENGGQD